MNTLNFDEIPQHTKDSLAAATLAAIKRHMTAEARKDLKPTDESTKRKEV